MKNKVIKFKRQGEKLVYGSMTEPGQSMTIRQLFARHRAGIMDGIFRPEARYDDDDEDYIDPDRRTIDQHDLSDIDEAKEFVEATKFKDSQAKSKKLKEVKAEKERRTKTVSDEKAISDVNNNDLDENDK